MRCPVDSRLLNGVEVGFERVPLAHVIAVFMHRDASLIRNDPP